MTARRLSDEQRTFLDACPRAVLATTRHDGRPRLVPVGFALAGGALVTAIDEKPKRSADPYRLARVRDILERPAVSLLVDRWDADWSRLAWLRLDGEARLVEPGAPGHDSALRALRERYVPYRSMALEGLPVIEIEPLHVVSWGNLGA